MVAHWPVRVSNVQLGYVSGIARLVAVAGLQIIEVSSGAGNALTAAKEGSSFWARLGWERLGCYLSTQVEEIVTANLDDCS